MILIDNRQDLISLNDEEIDVLNKVISFTLQKEQVLIPTEVSLTFVDNKEIREINRENRYIDRETDVLSFPMLEYPKGRVYKEVYCDYVFDITYLDGEDLVLGDIVLSLEKALEQSKEYGHSFKREICYLVVHSVLHLLGYDHIDEKDKNNMRKREEDILGEFNIGRD